MSDTLYYWTSTGSDELCDAMEGFHEGQPVRPHPNCVCDVQAVKDPADLTGGSDGTCYRIYYNVGPYVEVDGDGTGRLHIDYEIECFDRFGNVVHGESGTYEKEIEWDEDQYPDPDYWGSKNAEWESDADSEIGDIADNLCHGSCEAPDLT